MDITEVSVLHHIAIVLLLLWILASFGWSNTLLYFVSLFYLFAVNQHYTVRLRRKLHYEERKYANQRRLLSDSESVRWLNHAVEKVWLICMEQVASQQFLLPIIPWFLEKYKPWTVSKAVVEHLYLGRNPPMFTEIRVLGASTDDDHLVLELGLSFLSAKDMSAILSVQLRKSLGLGIWTNMHVTGMHVEGKVLVGVKFLRKWPFIGRLRVCFAEAPYFQMTVKPIINHGIDVTELPGIAGWMDNLLAVAFEQTLVEPNMLVIDVEKFVSTPTESWFSVYEKPPIAHVKLEIIEAADMKPSDLNGLADPYVRGHLGTFRLRTKTQKKTLSPKWFEEFKIPISSWETPNVLFLEVRDKDHIFDDMLGECSVNISDLRGGQRHDKWLNLRNIKMGRLHLAISVYEDEAELSKLSQATTPKPNTNAQNNTTDSSLEENQHMADEFEPINIEGQDKTGIWVHHPGKDVCQTWETRKGRSRRVAETELQPEIINEGTEILGSEASATAGSEENVEVKNLSRRATIGRGLQKIGSLFHRTPNKQSSREEEQVIPTPRPNIRALNKKGTAVRIILDDSFIADSGDQKEETQNISPGKDAVDSPGKKNTSKKIMEGEGVGKPSLNVKGVLKRKGSTRSKPDQTLEREGSWKKVQPAGEEPRNDVTPSYHESMENKEMGIPAVGEAATEMMQLQSMNVKENFIEKASLIR